jgi:hypothetical protein
MSSENLRTIRSWASLAGAMAVACAGTSARAGQDIVFSAPSKDIALPMAERSEKEDNPRAPISLNNYAPNSADFSLMPRVIYIGPARHSKNGSHDFGSMSRNLSDRNDRTDGSDSRDSNDNFDSETDARRILYGNFDPRSYGDDSGNSDNSSYGREYTSRQLQAMRGNFSGGTNRSADFKGWNSDPSKKGDQNKRDEYSAAGSLRESELDAWHSDKNSADKKDDTFSSSWGSERNGEDGSSRRSAWSRATGSGSFFDRARGDYHFHGDENKSAYSSWRIEDHYGNSAASGAADWRHDSGIFAPISGASTSLSRSTPFEMPKAEDSMSFKPPTGLMASDLNGPSYEPPAPRQEFAAPAPAPPPPPAILAFPKKPWEH